MLKILRRKPKESMTPGQRDKPGLAILFTCGIAATLGVCYVFSAVAVQSAIEEGLTTVADWLLPVSLVIGSISLTYLGLRVAGLVARSLLSTGEVRPESPDDAVLQYGGRLQRHLRWKIGMLAACSACSGFCLIMGSLATPTIVSALVAGEGMPQLTWVNYGFLWGGGCVFAFMAYLQARNFVLDVNALVRLNLFFQLQNRREREVIK